ncbi:MAG: hypothetical protein IBX43_04725 [Campylobacterales bacterium]|nr:hypothetical protein [Campylobacterales bacterium]
MDKMYAMSLDIHLYSVGALMLMMLLMMALHKSKRDLDTLVKTIQGVMIVYLCLLAFVILTGAIMMAVQHLSLTPANLLMTAAAVIVVALEIKRNKALAKTIKSRQMGADTYKRVAFRYYLIELILFVGVWTFAAMAY